MKTTTVTISGMQLRLNNHNGSLELVLPSGKTIAYGEDAYGETAVRFGAAGTITAIVMAKSNENTRKVAAAIDRVMRY